MEKREKLVKFTLQDNSDWGIHTKEILETSKNEDGTTTIRTEGKETIVQENLDTVHEIIGLKSKKINVRTSSYHE